MNAQFNETVDIVVPCYNPQDGWEVDLHNRFLDFVRELPEVQLRCILVNDGSTQGVSDKVIAYLQDSIPNFVYHALDKNHGKGYAIRAGIARTESAIVGFTDVDVPYQTRCMMEMFNIVKSEEADIVIGHRRGNYYEKIPFGRRLLSKSLRSTIKFLLNIPVTDTQSGLKFFNVKGKKVLMETKVDRYLFDLEFIKLAAKRGLSIKSIELALREGILLPPFAMRTLTSELGNFLKILFR